MTDDSIVWRRLGIVKPLERDRFLFFMAVASLVSFGQTLGLAGSEALFLGRYGVEFLPHTFLLASLVTIFGMLIYAALVGSTRNDKLFVHLLWLSGVLLIGGARAAASDTSVLPGLVAAFFLTQALFINHFWTFASDYFDALTTKRLAHLFTLAASAGGAMAGLAVLGISRVASPEVLIVGWGLVLVAAAGLIRFSRRWLYRWGLVELVEQDETSLEGITSAMRYVRHSRLGSWLVGSAAAMTITLFVSQYMYSEIFSATFGTVSELAVFFGLFLFASNLAEISIAFLITPWLVRHIGVARSNLVHPLVTVGSYVVLAVDPRLAAGVFARVNREVLENALSAPVRHLTYNAISLRLRGRMRALVEGIVIYAMMALAGGLLLVGVEPAYLVAVGAFTSLVYLFTNLRVGDEYLKTLVGGIREGRIDVAHLDDQLASWDGGRLASLWDSLVDERSRFASNAVQLAPRLAERGVVAPLVRGASNSDPRVRHACVAALATTPDGVPEDVLVALLHDRDPEVRREAVRALSGPEEELAPVATSRPSMPPDISGTVPALPELSAAPAVRRRSYDAQLRTLLADDEPSVRAEAALAMGASGVDALAAMARSEVPEEAVAALSRLPEELAPVALERSRDSEPSVRAAALEVIATMADTVSVRRDDLVRDLEHADPQVRAAAVVVLAASASASEHALESAARSLADPSRPVRTRTVEALRRTGEAGCQAALPYLRSTSQGAAEAAIEVVSAIRTPAIRKVLQAELRRRSRQAWGDMLAFDALPNDQSLSTRFLRAAHIDAVRQNQFLCFRLLRGLEDPSVVESVERALRLGSPRTRGDALEVLSNLGDRTAAHLLVVMLEDSPIESKIRTLHTVAPEEIDTAVDADRRAFDIWIRMGESYVRKDGGEDVSQRETMERLMLLREIPIFSQLSLEQLEAINSNMTERHFLPGEVVVREGEPGGELYLLLDGVVQALTGFGTPEESILNTLESPSYFGEMAILDDRPRSATVRVMNNARLLALNGDSFKDLMLQMPEISFEICRSLSTRVRRLEQA